MQVQPVQIDPNIKDKIAEFFNNYSKNDIKNLLKNLSKINIVEFDELKLPSYWITEYRAMLNHSVCNNTALYKVFVNRLQHAARICDLDRFRNACGIPGDYSFKTTKDHHGLKEWYNGRTFEWSVCKDSYINFLTIALCVYKQDKTQEETYIVFNKLKTIFTIN